VRRSTTIAGGVSALVIAIAVLTHNGSSDRPAQARQPEVVAAASPAPEQVEHAAALSRPAVVNVYLARRGFANDKYLKQFRSENPALARQLDAAFAAARSERAGLWGACFRTGQRSSVATSVSG
jgi:hypothetical protein